MHSRTRRAALAVQLNQTGRMRLEVSLEEKCGAIRTYVLDNGADDHEWNGAHVRLHQSCALAFPDMPLMPRETSSMLACLCTVHEKPQILSFFLSYIPNSCEVGMRQKAKAVAMKEE